MANRSDDRRGFLRGLTAASGLAAAAPLGQAQAQTGGDREFSFLPRYALHVFYPGHLLALMAIRALI